METRTTDLTQSHFPATDATLLLMPLNLRLLAAWRTRRAVVALPARQVNAGLHPVLVACDGKKEADIYRDRDVTLL